MVAVFTHAAVSTPAPTDAHETGKSHSAMTTGVEAPPAEGDGDGETVFD